MNSSRPIDISKSSLISLKAELSRKQAEVSSVKVNKANYVCPTINPNKKPLPAAKSKFCKNVEDNADDKSSSVAEENSKALEHSRNVLEIKSKLYDELKQGRLVMEKGRGAEYLVDFSQKTSEKCDDVSGKEKEDDQKDNVSEDDEYDRPSDPEEDWVDYTDIVGRQRRCLRRDLDAMRARDAESLLPPPPSPPPPPPVGCLDEDSDASAAQRTSRELQPPAAPHIEAMRRQWRKQEEKLLEKDSVHYEDLLFNEARTHGVGYYAFSTDESERAREMRELERRRQETLQRQADAQGLRARRDAQLKARLQAAKARNRQRLGLPPVADGEEDQKDDVVLVEKTDETKTEDESDKKEELEAALKRAAHIRPWDAEKLGLKIVTGDQPAVMSQSEWVDMKREERVSEFAPPQMYNQNRGDASNNHETEDLSTPLPSRSKSLFFTSKREKASNKLETDNDISASLPSGSKSLFFTSKREKSSNKLETDNDISAALPSESKSLFFTSKRPKAADFFNQQQPQPSTEDNQKQSNSQYRTNQQSRNQYQTEELSRNQYRTHEQSKSLSQCSDRLVDDFEEPVKRKRTEIPPPMTAEYFGGTGKPKYKQLPKCSGVGESISEGLKYLNEQKKVNNNKRDKGLLDIM